MNTKVLVSKGEMFPRVGVATGREELPVEHGELVWVRKDGTRVPLSKMNEQHMLNCLRKIQGLYGTSRWRAKFFRPMIKLFAERIMAKAVEKMDGSLTHTEMVMLETRTWMVMEQQFGPMQSWPKGLFEDANTPWPKLRYKPTGGQ